MLFIAIFVGLVHSSAGVEISALAGAKCDGPYKLGPKTGYAGFYSELFELTLPNPGSTACTIKKSCSDVPGCLSNLHDAISIFGSGCDGADATVTIPGWTSKAVPASVPGRCIPCATFNNTTPPTPGIAPNAAAQACGILNLLGKKINPEFWGPKLYGATLGEIPWGAVGNAFKSAGGEIGGFFTGIGSGFVSGIGDFGGYLKDGTFAAGDFFKNIGSSIGNAFKGVFGLMELDADDARLVHYHDALLQSADAIRAKRAVAKKLNALGPTGVVGEYSRNWEEAI